MSATISQLASANAYLRKAAAADAATIKVLKAEVDQLKKANAFLRRAGASDKAALDVLRAKVQASPAEARERRQITLQAAEARRLAVALLQTRAALCLHWSGETGLRKECRARDKAALDASKLALSKWDATKPEPELSKP